MEEQESQGRPVCPPGPVVFQPGNSPNLGRKSHGLPSTAFKEMCYLESDLEARHIVASVDPEWTADANSPQDQPETQDDAE
jgi:hypothetical protein